MIRLFTALEIPDEIAERLTPLQRGIEHARWIESENFHITLRFIGDVPENIADDIDTELARIPFKPLTLTLEGVGAFGGAEPHAIYASVRPDANLTILQGRHESAMRRVGMKPDSQNFTPHVTLARLPRRIDLGEVFSFVAEHNLLATPTFVVPRFILYSAKEKTGGGPYVKERAYPDGVYADDLTPDVDE
ncbi:MAG: RNA 2',3'-cyclic phosphodiesterase [Pseudomonadota bacterium]